MNIIEKINVEEKRHNEKIRELNELLKMYNNDVRDYYAYVDSMVDEAVKSGVKAEKILQQEESRKTVHPYEKQIEDINESIKKENELYAKNMADLMAEKQNEDIAKNEEDIARQKEQEQKEIELINLQQEINRMENEKLEIEKRIKQISSEALGSFFSKKVSEKYPSEYQSFQQQKEQVKKYKSGSAQITDLQEKFHIVSQDLQFYQKVLPVYENFYKRFKQMEEEWERKSVSQKDQEKKYNLIYSEENERLQKSGSLYTAWDLENKTMPPEYQGMTYEQAETMINQEKEQERQDQMAQSIREDLINKAIRKYLGVSEDYHLTDIQIRNLRSQFDNYNDEELKDYVSEVKKQETSVSSYSEPEKNLNSEFEQTKTERKQVQVDERERERIYNLIHKAENERLQKSRSLYTAWDLGDKTIPPEYQGMTYEQVETLLNQKEANEKARQEEKKTRDELIVKAIRKDLHVPDDYHLSQIQIQNLSQQFANYTDDELKEFISGLNKQEITSEVRTEEVSQTITPNEQTQQREKLINDILGAMLNAGEFHNSGLDISQKMSDMEYVKRNLETKSLEELEYILSVYTPRQAETMSSGEIKR